MNRHKKKIKNNSLLITLCYIFQKHLYLLHPSANGVASCKTLRNCSPFWVALHNSLLRLYRLQTLDGASRDKTCTISIFTGRVKSEILSYIFTQTQKFQGLIFLILKIFRTRATQIWSSLVPTTVNVSIIYVLSGCIAKQAWSLYLNWHTNCTCFQK